MTHRTRMGRQPPTTASRRRWRCIGPRGARAPGALAVTRPSLDAGCGSGRITAALLDRLPRGRVIGVDGAPSMIDAARERLGERPSARAARRRPRASSTSARARRRGPLDRDVPLDHRPRRRCSRACAAPCATAARLVGPVRRRREHRRQSARRATPCAPRRAVRRAPRRLAPGRGASPARRRPRRCCARRASSTARCWLAGAAGDAPRTRRPATQRSSSARTSGQLARRAARAVRATACSGGCERPARDPLRAPEHRRRRLTARRPSRCPSSVAVCTFSAVQRRPQPAAAIRLRDGRVPSPLLGLAADQSEDHPG